MHSPSTGTGAAMYHLPVQGRATQRSATQPPHNRRAVRSATFPAAALADRSAIPTAFGIPAESALYALGFGTLRPTSGAALLPPTAAQPLAQIFVWGEIGDEAVTLATRARNALEFYFARYDGPDFPLLHVLALPAAAAGPTTSSTARDALARFVRQFELTFNDALYGTPTQRIVRNAPPVLRLIHGETLLLRQPIGRAACYVEPDDRGGIRRRWFAAPASDDRLEPLANGLAAPFSIPHLLLGTRDLPGPLQHIWGLIQQGRLVSERALATIPLSLDNRIGAAARDPAEPERARRWRIVHQRLAEFATRYGVTLPGTVQDAPLADTTTAPILPTTTADANTELAAADAALAGCTPPWHDCLTAWIAAYTAQGMRPAIRSPLPKTPTGRCWEADFVLWVLEGPQQKRFGAVVGGAERASIRPVIAAMDPTFLRWLFTLATRSAAGDALMTRAILHYLSPSETGATEAPPILTDMERNQIETRLLTGPEAPPRHPRARTHGLSRAIARFRQTQHGWLAQATAATAQTNARTRQRIQREIAQAMLDFRLEAMDPLER